MICNISKVLPLKWKFFKIFPDIKIKVNRFPMSLLFPICSSWFKLLGLVFYTSSCWDWTYLFQEIHLFFIWYFIKVKEFSKYKWFSRLLSVHWLCSKQRTKQSGQEFFENVQKVTEVGQVPRLQNQHPSLRKEPYNVIYNVLCLPTTFFSHISISLVRNLSLLIRVKRLQIKSL